MKRRILSLLVCLTMVLTMIPMTAFAETSSGTASGNWADVADTSWYTDENKQVVEYVRGDNTFEQDTYTIETAEELAGLAKLVNDGNTFTAVVIKLGADIDLTQYEWTPIGESSAKPFMGHFDGQNNTIKGLNIDGGTNAGLFGYIKNNTTNYLCSFENVTFENVTIKNATNAGALFGDGKFAQRHEWYGGVLQVHNVKVIGDVAIEGTNAGAVVGSGWLGVRMAASDIVVNVNAGSYIHGTAVAGGVFASSPHSGGGNGKMENITSNIDVRGEGVVGGIAGKAGWYWENITCTGTITATGTTNAGTIFGQISDNPYWTNNHAVDYVGMTGLNGNDATLTMDGINSTQEFPSKGEFGDTEFVYADGKVCEKTALVSIEGGEPVLMTWAEAIKAVEGKTATITLKLASGVSTTTEYGIKVPANTNLTIDLGGYRLYGTIFSEGDLTVKNGQIYSYEFTSAIESYGENASLTIEDDVTVKSYRHALRIEGGKATINDGVFQTWGRDGQEDTAHALNAGGIFATEVTINGGEFRGMKYDKYAENADSSAAVNAQNNATVTINDGKFGHGQNDTLLTSGSGKIVAKGGTYDQNPSAFAARGYIADEAEGKWTVSKDKNVAAIGDTKFESIEDAIAAAKDGETVKLLNDCAATKPLRINKAITLDLNGCTLSADRVGVHMFTVMADFTVIGEGKIAATGIDEIFNVGNAKLTLTGNAEYTSEYSVIYPGGTADVVIENGTFASTKGDIFNMSAAENATVTKADDVTIAAPKGYFWKGETELVAVETLPVEYTIIEGAGQEVTKGENATFTSDAPSEKYEAVMIDGEVIGEENFNVVDGSTKVTLTADYTGTLEVGKEYVIAIVSTDGQASTKFTVKAPEQNPPAGGDNEQNPPAGGDSGNGTTPTDKPAGEAQDKGNAQTGDDFNMAIPFMLALMALTGMTVTVVARKRNIH